MIIGVSGCVVKKDMVGWKDWDLSCGEILSVIVICGNMDDNEKIEIVRENGGKDVNVDVYWLLLLGKLIEGENWLNW